jgi:hypothetical protein
MYRMNRHFPGKTGMFTEQKNLQREEEERNKPLLGRATSQESYSTDPQAVRTQVARNLSLIHI